MEEESSASSRAAASASSATSTASSSSSSSSSAEAVGAARRLQVEPAPDDGIHGLNRPLQIRGRRDIRVANMQQAIIVQQAPDAQVIERVAANGMALQDLVEYYRDTDFVDRYLDAPSSSQVNESSTSQEAQQNEAPSWFESSVEGLLRSIQPSGQRQSKFTLDMTAEGYLSSGQGADMLNHKRPKVLGSAMSGANMNCHTSQWGLAHSKSQQRALSSSLQSSLQNKSVGQQTDLPGGGSSDSVVAQGSDSPSIYVTEDLLHTVFSFLDQKSLCQAARVCRQWRAASEHEDFWRSLQFGSKITYKQVASVCRRFPRAVDLSFCHVNSVDNLARQAMHSLRHLEKLSIYKGNLSDSFFKALAIGCPALRSLIIHDVYLGNLGMQDVKIRHKNLCILQVTECRVMRIGIGCPSLEKLSLRQTNMASAILECPRLLSLDVSSCMKLSDAGVRLAASNCGRLLALNVSQCSYISDETLQEICLSSTNLQVLDASVCPNISLQGVRMAALKELKLNNCESINSSSITALSQCLMLEDITLDACVLLLAVSLNLECLQRISLTNCNKLVELTLQCPALVDLDVAGCTALARLDISSLALKKLTLQKQMSLKTLGLNCLYLLVMILLECDSLVANSICDVLSDGGGCPRLNSLTLESCESLRVLHLSSTALQTLSLTGCQNLVQIELACPNLQDLVLDGCRQLSCVSLAPVGLRSLNLGICPYVTTLRVEASTMTYVDLSGCGILKESKIVCPQLLSLDASYCSLLNDQCLETATMACPLIQSLVLASCPSVGPAGLTTLRKLGSLTTLDLSYTFLTDLSPVFESCKQLKVLRLLACKYLEDSALNALWHKETLPELRELALAFGELGHDALMGVLTRCSYLTHVDLNGCAKLGDLVWDVNSRECAYGLQGCQQQLQISGSSLEFQKSSVAGYSSGSWSLLSTQNLELQCYKMALSHSVQHLSCVGCPNMRRVEILDALGFHDLTCLNLSLSNNLKEVYLECPALMTLSLSHCTALESLQMSCPRLVSLSLQESSISASGLENVLQACTALETLDLRNCVKIATEDLIDVRAACPRLRRLLSSTLT